MASRSLTQTARRQTPVVSLLDAKEFLREFADHQDDVIANLVEAATDLIEHKAKRLLGSQEWVMTASGFHIFGHLPLWPVTTVNSFEVRQDDGSYLAFSTNDLQIADYGTCHGLIMAEGADEPYAEIVHPEAFRANLVAGEPDPKEGLVAAIKLLVATWYDGRMAQSPQQMSDVPFGVAAMIAPYRRYT